MCNACPEENHVSTGVRSSNADCQNPDEIFRNLYLSFGKDILANFDGTDRFDTVYRGSKLKSPSGMLFNSPYTFLSLNIESGTIDRFMHDGTYLDVFLEVENAQAMALIPSTVDGIAENERLYFLSVCRGSEVLFYELTSTGELSSHESSKVDISDGVPYDISYAGNNTVIVMLEDNDTDKFILRALCIPSYSCDEASTYYFQDHFTARKLPSSNSILINRGDSILECPYVGVVDDICIEKITSKQLFSVRVFYVDDLQDLIFLSNSESKNVLVYDFDFKLVHSITVDDYQDVIDVAFKPGSNALFTKSEFVSTANAVEETLIPLFLFDRKNQRIDITEYDAARFISTLEIIAHGWVNVIDSDLKFEHKINGKEMYFDNDSAEIIVSLDIPYAGHWDLELIETMDGFAFSTFIGNLTVRPGPTDALASVIVANSSIVAGENFVVSVKCYDVKGNPTDWDDSFEVWVDGDKEDIALVYVKPGQFEFSLK